MELGATVCLPNGAPLCERCPAAPFCRAFQEGRTGELPVKAAKKARKVEVRTVYLLFCQGRVALRRRGPRGLLAGLWEYPNELADGTDWPASWGLDTVPLERLGAGKHIFTHIEWHMTAMGGELGQRRSAGRLGLGRPAGTAGYLRHPQCISKLCPDRG